MKNKKLYYRAVLLAGAIILIAVIFKRSGFFRNTNAGNRWDETLIGIYDRSGNLEMADLQNIRHASMILTKTPDQSDLGKILKIDKNVPVLFTLEISGDEGYISLPEFTEGKYDESVTRLCRFLVDNKINAFLRWNPEMEVSAHLYPWQNQAGDTYIKAFRHFSNLCKEVSSDIKIVWGPAGYPGVEDYWPGGDFVDLVSVTIQSKSEQVKSNYTGKSTESEITRKLYRMRFMDKPVLVLARPGNVPTFSKAMARSVTDLAKEDSVIYSFNHKRGIKDMTFSNRAAPMIGVYDPKLLLAKSKNVQIEHMFIDLGNINDGTFKQSFDSIVARNHDVILTVEPWKDKKNIDSTSLSNILKGLYDSEFRKLYQILSASKRTVYLRFAHEMEIPIHRYPWQSQEPVLYIKAFRYFMNFGNSINIKRVWGPAGDRGSMEFWPGEDVVDYVSLAIYGLPDKNIADHSKQELFSTIYRRKFHRVRLANKPIFITEFGVTGPEDFQSEWIANASEVVNQHSEIFGVCYFNLADNPKVWGDIPTPVWSITPKTFNRFVTSLTRGTVQK